MSRRWDLGEAVANAIIGLVVSWAGTMLILPAFGHHPTAADAAGITASFFALSAARSYALRRLFRRLET